MQWHRRLVGLVVLIAFASLALPSVALSAEGGGEPAVWDDGRRPNYVLAQDSLNLEDGQGYTGEYIFGMTKGIMRSTLTPALKPVMLLLTVPLDIAFLPFAAIAGFFR